jgi:hypothetical protein
MKVTTFGGLTREQHDAIKHTNEMIAENAIKNVNVANDAGISQSKLNLNADPASHHTRHEPGGADAFTALGRNQIADLFNSPFWGNIPDKPTSFNPSAHASTHIAGGADAITAPLNPAALPSGTLKVGSETLLWSSDAEASSNVTGGYTLKSVTCNDKLAIVTKVSVEDKGNGSTYYIDAQIRFTPYSGGTSVALLSLGNVVSPSNYTYREVSNLKILVPMYFGSSFSWWVNIGSGITYYARNFRVYGREISWA